MNSTQCSLTVCNMTSITSIIKSTAKVADAHTTKPIKSYFKTKYKLNKQVIKLILTPMTDPDSSELARSISKKTLASWLWANESAQRRKYDAVFDIVPSANSIVWIIELIAIAIISNSSPSPWWPLCLPATRNKISSVYSGWLSTPNAAPPSSSRLSPLRTCWLTKQHKRSELFTLAHWCYLFIIKYLVIAALELLELKVAAAPLPLTSFLLFVAPEQVRIYE